MNKENENINIYEKFNSQINQYSHNITKNKLKSNFDKSKEYEAALNRSKSGITKYKNLSEAFTIIFYVILCDIILGILIIHCIHYVIKISSNARSLNKCKFSEKELEKILDHPCLHQVVPKSEQEDNEDEEEIEQVIEVNEEKKMLN